ncbi:hypothetical protein SNOG_08556 [Parastagonospora nodorum SN15]|uniref:Uncharacterized protein n=1 Tax=Phaeosphaeria nodorum (strain SN15 / ATCC MYA-4574 / FGSC 10173) TaxID=321614 RepID=Q0UI58_PHANO|nr:hypothetical protein SNOG_08556 [Parastagonospora nodorum SN15]EAT83724.1 hypothetical protein SNOG_08556 [Parastagonospora nodorum SN15]
MAAAPTSSSISSKARCETTHFLRMSFPVENVLGESGYGDDG